MHNEEAKDNLRYLYTLFMAVDANFRLKLKNRKLADVSLSPGWGYYVAEDEYKKYLNERVNDNEVSIFPVSKRDACQY